MFYRLRNRWLASWLVILSALIFQAPLDAQGCGNPSGSWNCYGYSCYVGGYCSSDYCEFDLCKQGFGCSTPDEYINYCISPVYYCLRLFSGCHEGCGAYCT